jgi:hypothetical protein
MTVLNLGDILLQVSYFQWLSMAYIEEGESFDWMNKVGGGGLRSKWNRPELVRVDS